MDEIRYLDWIQHSFGQKEIESCSQTLVDLINVHYYLRTACGFGNLIFLALIVTLTKSLDACEILLFISLKCCIAL